eukprot:TRINITY_DN925_c0_g1_i1.p2 TRINITY_DN925_c0_g1~~TRINITY_DN925_c0_g1_i1.p2  ORF type:complete len:290 (-),score=106.24 TRINITY_DN925_c0_g1_i1:1208-2077(-)
MLPTTSFDGKLLLKSKTEISTAPNGNGGIYEALKKEKIIDDIQNKGIKYVFAYGVDNVLVKMADPTFIGAFHSANGDCGVKVVPKAHALERVGVVCLKNGKPAVVEYSEIGEDVAKETLDDGSLKYNTGNICTHLYSTEFLQKVTDNNLSDLMFHIAKKKIPHYDYESNTVVTPEEPNGNKYEQFIFDVFPYSEKIVAFQVKRKEEFSPLKNKEGNDSPASCLKLLTEYNKSLIEKVGGKFVLNDESKELGQNGNVIEISPLTSLNGEDLEFLANKTYHLPLHIFGTSD